MTQRFAAVCPSRYSRSAATGDPILNSSGDVLNSHTLLLLSHSAPESCPVCFEPDESSPHAGPRPSNPAVVYDWVAVTAASASARRRWRSRGGHRHRPARIAESKATPKAGVEHLVNFEFRMP